jgi:hypothetical protein
MNRKTKKKDDVKKLILPFWEWIYTFMIKNYFRCDLIKIFYRCAADLLNLQQAASGLYLYSNALLISIKLSYFRNYRKEPFSAKSLPSIGVSLHSFDVDHFQLIILIYSVEYL